MLSSLGKPELDALLLASRTRLPESAAAKLKETVARCQSAPWFVYQTLVEKTFPLVFLNVQTHCPHAETGFAADVIKRLRPAVVARWLPKREKLAELQAVLRQILEECRVPYMFLRGLSFAEQYYPVPPLRVSDDIDLLVPASAHNTVEDALVRAGFQYIRKPHFRQAQYAYEGLVELKHPEYPLAVDMVSKLTANSQIGPVSLDVDLVWQSAVPRQGGEFDMNPADLFVHLIRHISHGHLFEIGVVRCCADVAAFLKVAGPKTDWDHVKRQASHGQCWRGLEFFKHFYDRHYACESDPSLQPMLPSRPRILPVERQLFVRCVITKQMALQSRQNALWGKLLRMNLSLVTRFWLCDNPARILRLLHMIACPSREEAVLIDDENFAGPLPLRRLRIYALMAFVFSPGIVAGLLVRGVAALLRPFKRLLPARRIGPKARQRQ